MRQEVKGYDCLMSEARRSNGSGREELPELDPLTLRLVRAVLEHGSLTAAARELGYSQPAASQHLQRTERRLGLALVERAGRTVRLTEAGRVLARHASAVAAALEAAGEELAELRGLRAGHVRLAAFPSASSALVPRLLALLAHERPGLTVTFVEAEPPDAVAAVREGLADIALTFSYPGDRADPHGASARGLAVRTVGRDELLVVLPESHPAASGPVELAALAEETWIAGCPRCRGHLLESCDRAGFTPSIAFETDNIVAVEGLVAQGMGVATLPRLAVDSFPLLAGIVAQPFSSSESRTLHTVTARDAAHVPAVAVVLGAIARLASADGLGSALQTGFFES